jgi:Flp pilus assembly protein TadB
MSKERQRARAARESEQAKARVRAAKAAERKARLERATPSVPKPAKRQRVYRQRRFAPLPLPLKIFLAVFWLSVAAVVLLVVPTWTARIGFLAIATMLLPLIVVIVRDPTRRYR